MFSITNTTLTGVEQAVVLSDNITSVSFMPRANGITLSFTSGGATITIDAGQIRSLAGQGLSGKTVYVTGTAADVLEIVQLTGPSYVS